MARKTTLRAVTDADAAPTPVKPKSITEAADSGTQRELLVALRKRLASQVQDPNCPARDLAALSRRLLEVDREIRALDADSEGDDVGNAAATPDEEFAL